MENLEQSLADLGDLTYVAELSCSVAWPLKTIMVESIDIVKEKRGRGYGTNLMRSILALADENGLSVRLRPDYRYGTPMSVLEKFYERLGFKWDCRCSEYVYKKVPA